MHKFQSTADETVPDGRFLRQHFSELNELDYVYKDGLLRR
jgi:hypothetical protein